MGGTATANQLRLSFAGSEDGEAETETCRAAKPLWRTTTRTLRPVRAQLTEPPYADPHVRWCGRGERATAPPMPIIRLNLDRLEWCCHNSVTKIRAGALRESHSGRRRLGKPPLQRSRERWHQVPQRLFEL